MKIKGKKVDFAKVPKGISRTKLLRARKLPVWKGARLVKAKSGYSAINKILKPRRLKLARYSSWLRRA